MHELGIVTYVAKTVSKIAADNEVEKVAEVILEIGEVSGIIGEYLVDCWNYFRKNYPILTEAELRCEDLKAVTYCEDCKKEYPTVRHGRTCPHCGSGRTYLLVGNECNIREIKVYDA